MDMCLNAEARSCTAVAKSNLRSRDIKLINFSISFHDCELLSDTTLELLWGQRYGLIGLNGSGKSTLLTVLGNREVPIPDHIDIFHSAKEISSEETVLTCVMEVNEERLKLKKLAEELMACEDKESQEQLMDVNERLDGINQDTGKTRAVQILQGLGFTAEMQENKTKDLPVTWRMRIALARAMYVKPHLLLLDEPTKHLDFDACVWLLDELKKYKGIVVIISHSLSIMEKVCNKVMYLNERKIEYHTTNINNLLTGLLKTQMKRYYLEQDLIAHAKDSNSHFGHGSTELARPAQIKEKLDKVKYVALSTSNFEDLLHSESFVDKTMFIATIFLKNCNTSLVTAPPRMGKSANISMLKYFLTLEVDKEGNPVTKATKYQPVTDTKNYQLFTSYIPALPKEKLLISNMTEIMGKYLGKYAVLYVDFSCPSLESYKNAKATFTKAIREAFREHSYLITSKQLNENEKLLCKRWCSPINNEFSDFEIKGSLQELARCLFRHFNRQCYVLIDEYDGVCSSALLKLKTEDIQRTELLCVCILSNILKQSSPYVCSALLTGVSEIYTTGIISLNNLQKYRFLGNNFFFPYYGITFLEMEKLRTRFAHLDKKFDEVMQHYGGYEYEGKKVCNMWSVMSFLKKKEVGSYWVSSGLAYELASSLRANSVEKYIHQLLNSKNNTVDIAYNSLNITIEHITELKDFLENPGCTVADPNIIFRVLWEQGYLTTVGEINYPNPRITLKIPNIEIRNVFINSLEV